MYSRFTWILIFAFIIGLALPADAADKKTGKKEKKTPAPGKLFDLQAHRGGRGRVPPGNTLPAFEYALDLEVTTLEFDMHQTKDGEIIVIHDDNLPQEWGVAPEAKGVAVPDPRTAPKNSITYNQLTLDQIKAYRCPLRGDLKSLPGRNPETAHLMIDENSASIPTLREVFTFVRNYANNDRKTKTQRENATKVLFNIETKTAGFEQQVVDIVKEFKLEDRVTVQSFIHPSIAEIARLEPAIQTSALDGEPDKIVKETKAKIWSPNYKRLSKKAIKHAHAKGLQVVPWTVNDAASMEQLINWGVDGIISDYPDILKGILDKRHIPYTNR